MDFVSAEVRRNFEPPPSLTQAPDPQTETIQIGDLTHAWLPRLDHTGCKAEKKGGHAVGIDLPPFSCTNWLFGEGPFPIADRVTRQLILTCPLCLPKMPTLSGQKMLRTRRDAGKNAFAQPYAVPQVMRFLVER
jgi:hypothetical protein